jgi:hypothetical protein
MAEVSWRELSETYRFLLDSRSLDRLDSVYFLAGDAVTDLSASATFRAGRGLGARIAARAGEVRTRTAGAANSNRAAYGSAEAALNVLASRTSLILGYRTVNQHLWLGDDLSRNELDAFSLSVEQTLPLRFLKSLGPELRAILGAEVGDRFEGESGRRTYRRLSGGLGLAF